MARFANSPHDLRQWSRTVLAPPPPLPPAEPADASPACGPGWYESSLDLRNGLDVREGLPADAGLDEWLGACLLC